MKTGSRLDPSYALAPRAAPSRGLPCIFLALTACAVPPREAPMIARPESVVVHVSPDALVPKSAPCPSPRLDPSPIRHEEIEAAVSRVPPSEQRIEILAVHAAPTIEGRLRIQGRGRGIVNGGAPWHTAVSYLPGATVTPLSIQSASGASLEVALPGDVSGACEEAVKTALREGKALAVTGTGLFASTAGGASSFGLFVLEHVTSCSPHS